MKKIRKQVIAIKTFIPLLLISLTFLFCLTAVSAADNDTIYVNGSHGDDNWDGLSWTTAKLTIKNATGTVNTNGTIYIANGIYTGENNTNITIDKNMSIIGQSQNGTIINGTGTNWIFTVNYDAKLILQNITLTNAKSEYYGGAIYNTGTLNVSGCTFTGNTAGYDGGAIWNRGNCTISNSIFTGNIVTYGGGAIWNGGNCTVSNSTFINNTATYDGGAIDNGGTLNVSDCTFKGNTATWGGAIRNFEDVTVNDCIFTGNKADYDGGAIYSTGKCTVSKSTFTGNVAGYSGGAIWNNGTLTVTGGTFGSPNVEDSNTVTYGGGGAIYNTGNCTVSNSTFNGNKAIYYSGAIDNDGTLNISGCTFTGNTATYGSAIYSTGNCTVSNSTFSDNAADYDGGAIYNLSGTINVEKCAFLNNTVSCSGGAIYNYNGNVAVINCIFSDNAAVYDGGGAIHNWNGILNITNSTFNGNKADYYGGAIWNGGTISLSGCTFTGNTATDGGAIYNLGNLTAENCTFTGNTAANNYGGGAIYNGNTISLIGCNFTNNTANSDGGAINNIALFHDVTSTIVNCTFTGNRATYRGGAIASGSDGYSVISSLIGCSFTGNTVTSDYGDGGAISNRGTLIANFNRFYNNTAEYGNAISGIEFDSVDIESNWWSSNNPNWDSLIDGLTNPNNWVILSINAIPNSIDNTKTSTITADFNHVNGGGELIGGHIPDGPITLEVPWGSLVDAISGTGNLPILVGIGGSESPLMSPTAITHSITLNTIGGVIAATFYASEGAVNPLFNPVKVTATADNYTTNNTESAYITINKTSDLYIKITSDKKNTKVGETFTLTYKLGNNGPDEATNVVISIPLPEGFELSNIRGDGNWTYNSATRTITWTLKGVPVGDPYLYISGNVLRPGYYVFSSSISSETYNINSEGVMPITINAVSQVKAASTTKTIPLRHTGLPLAGLVLAVLAVFGGLLMPKRKN